MNGKGGKQRGVEGEDSRGLGGGMRRMWAVGKMNWRDRDVRMWVLVRGEGRRLGIERLRNGDDGFEILGLGRWLFL